jgi:hypothetical protein
VHKLTRIIHLVVINYTINSFHFFLKKGSSYESQIFLGVCLKGLLNFYVLPEPFLIDTVEPGALLLSRHIISRGYEQTRMGNRSIVR